MGWGLHTETFDVVDKRFSSRSNVELPEQDVILSDPSSPDVPHALPPNTLGQFSGQTFSQIDISPPTTKTTVQVGPQIDTAHLVGMGQDKVRLTRVAINHFSLWRVNSAADTSSTEEADAEQHSQPSPT